MRDPDDPFVLPPQERLRKAIRVALGGLEIGDRAKAELENLRVTLGVRPEVASRIFTEVKTEIWAEVYPVDVNTGLTLEAMVALGRYDLPSPEVVQKLSVRREYHSHQELKLLHFTDAVSLDEVVGRLGQRDLRPGSLEELLAFGARYPDLQRTWVVVALGSISDDRRVPYLSGNAGLRSLFMTGLDHGWPAGTRFLAAPRTK